MLLAAGAPTAARAQSAGTWQFDGTALLYGEQTRAKVVEPVARVTRLFPDGQSLSAQFGIDAITGASPSGAMPSGLVQTTTTPSGNVKTLPAGEIPTSAFKDLRGALDLEWVRPLGGRLTSTTGAHFSREKDYQSLGANAKLSLDFMQRLTTLTVGGGINRDGVFPTGGTPVGLSDGTEMLGTGTESKRVANGMIGLSRVLTRRWMLGINASREVESGYLTEPYKVVSLVDEDSGLPAGQVTEKRPSSRDRTSILGSSVYHLSQDVLYLSYRYYRDDWGLRSHTIDFKYRRELPEDSWLQPHLRLYTQSHADFFVFGLPAGQPLPEFATSDYRLGPLKTATIGATYGFRIPNYRGELTLRGEYIVQWGDGHPKEAVGALSQFDLMPPLSIGSLMIGYSVPF
jgi:hypothetical protein